MIQTYKGKGASGSREYEFEVFKEGHILTLNVFQNGRQISAYWLHSMKEVRDKIRLHYTTQYVLERLEKDEE